MLAVPVLLYRDGDISASPGFGINILLEVLRWFSRCAAHPALSLRTKIGVRPGGQAKIIRF